MSGPTVEEMMAANKSHLAPGRGVLVESLRRTAVTLNAETGRTQGSAKDLKFRGSLSFIS